MENKKDGFLKKLGKVFVNTGVYWRYDKTKIDERMVFFESRNGRDLAGNILRLVIEIERTYPGQYRLCTAARKECREKIRSILAAYQISSVTICEYDGIRHVRLLHRAKYLLNDTTFPRRYIKREGQVYLNTWHGTPYKCMGVDSASDRHLIDNVQRNLLMSDYLLYPSAYCEKKMTEAYCVHELFEGRILEEGYPRNTVLLDQEVWNEVRSRYAIGKKRVYIYMPTFRESVSGHRDEEQMEFLRNMLNKMDQELSDDELLVVKLHYYVESRLDLSQYRHIRPFPEGIETYEFLSGCDCLITDYSSVFYDFANTGRKIIRFLYDEDSYASNRGFYEQPVELPFPVVRTTEALIDEMRIEKAYDDTEFRKAFCTYDRKGAAARVVKHLFGDAQTCREHQIHDDAEHVVVYAGSLAMNGITTSLQSLLRAIQDNRKYYISFCRNILNKNPENIVRLPEGCASYGLSGEFYPTIIEMIANTIFFTMNREGKWIRKIRDRFYERDIRRSFYGTDFTTYIQFAGYDRHIIGLFQRADARRVIFVHNDMVEEIRLKHVQRFMNLRSAYRNYDKVAVVSEQLIESTFSISGRRDNIIVVENCIDVKRIRDRAQMEIDPDPYTLVTCSDPEGIAGFLRKHEPRIITIGRFSPEKAHARLIKAFERFAQDHPKAGLIIIGGDGPLYKETVEQVRTGGVSESIMLIRDISNPMPILAKCDLFILASLYEGLGLTLLEADCLGIPNVGAEVTGISGFRRNHQGAMVPNDPEGILGAMEAFMKGEIGTMEVDYLEYNQTRIQQFETLFLNLE